MKKKTIIIIIAVIVLLAAALTAGLLLQRNYMRKTYITIGSQQYLRAAESLTITVSSEEELQLITELGSLKTLDLGNSALTTAQYDALRAALPGCDIRWKVPFQGKTFDCGTEKLNITALAQEDIAILAYFPNLTKVNARGCTDYEQLLILTQTYPELEVYYSIEFDGQFWPNSTTAMEISSAALQELEGILPYFPLLESVKLADMPEDPEAVWLMQQAHPEIAFYYQLTVCGVAVDNTAEEIDLSGISMDSTEELESKLKYLPNLTKVDMCGCGFSNEEMEALNNRHEGVLFVWIVNIGHMPVRTDIDYFIPAKTWQRIGNDDCKNLRYCTELVALDLGHMPLESCEFVSYMPHLKYLIMADSGLMDISPLAGLKELVFLELFLTYITDYSPLVTLTALDDLNISHTHGDMEPLTQMTWLKRLWWGNNPGEQMSDEDYAYLQECLPNTKIVTDLVYSTGRGWRQGGHYYDMRDYFGMWYMDQD